MPKHEHNPIDNEIFDYGRKRIAKQEEAIKFLKEDGFVVSRPRKRRQRV